MIKTPFFFVCRRILFIVIIFLLQNAAFFAAAGKSVSVRLLLSFYIIGMLCGRFYIFRFILFF